MEKICNILLNYNMDKMTDSVYEELKPYIDSDTNIIVYDVSDKPKKMSKYTTHAGKDDYYGNNFKNILLLCLELDVHYDWFVLMSNDVYQFPRMNWLRELVNIANKYNAKIISPSFKEGDSFFNHMFPQGDCDIHFVNWIDFPCPIIHRSVIEAIIDNWPSKLKYGWGVESLFGIYATKNNIQTIVADYITIRHYREKTFKEKVDVLSEQEYNKLAAMNEEEYFIYHYGRYEWFKWKFNDRIKILRKEHI